MLRFEREFLDYLRRTRRASCTTIRETGKFDDDTAAALQSELDAFKKASRPRTASASRPATRSTSALEDEDVEQEQIVKQKRG